MLSLSVGEIVQATGGVLVIGDPRASVGSDPAIPGRPGAKVSLDSRTLQNGDVFFAVKGERFDGHEFVNEAIRRGAALCVVAHVPQNLALPSRRAPAIVKVKDSRKALADCAKFYRAKYGKEIDVVAITGSSGKTTIKEMTAQILSRAAPTVYSQGNFNNEIGCPLSVLSIGEEHRYGVFELGASAVGEVGRLAEVVAPKVAVISTIGLEHTETFGDLRNIAAGESEALPALPEGGWAVLPADDGQFDYLKSRVAPGARVKSFGWSKAASVSAEGVRVAAAETSGPLKPGGSGPSMPYPQLVTEFTLLHRDDSGGALHRIECALPALGKFNVLNACAAAAACFCLGLPPEAVRDGLKDFVPMKMRFQILRLKDDVIVINDSYNANPGSMRAALESFVDAFPGVEKSVVLADMLELGEISRNEHYALGRHLAGLPLTKTVLFGPQSRFVFDGAREAFLDEKALVYCSDREELLRAARSLVQPRMAILFKASRGMRLEEIIQKLTEEE